MRVMAAWELASAAGSAAGTAAGEMRPPPQRLRLSSRRNLHEEFWHHLKRVNAKRRRASLALAIPLIAFFGIVDAYVAPEAIGRLWLVRFGILLPVVITVLALTFRQPLHRWSEARIAIGIVIAGACLTAMTLIAASHASGVLLLVFASYTFLGLRSTHAIGSGVLVTMLYLVAIVAEGSASPSTIVTHGFFLAGCNVIGAFVCHSFEEAARREFRRNSALTEHRQVSERLLRNVLPVRIGRRLKSRVGAIADVHPNVTVLFADIADFTSYAAAVAPARLVLLLDQVFTCFDQLALKHGVEKIKTIGDAYMVAGGLQNGGGDDARAVAEMALDMLEAVAKLDPGNGRRLALHIGIDTGPVVAGVIGRTKFAYDIWGDTVNVASRLEGLAASGTIQVSQSTYERLRDDYVFSPRQIVAVKGLGELPSYRLVARKAFSRAPAVDQRPTASS